MSKAKTIKVNTSRDVYVAQNSLRVHPILTELREHTEKNVKGSVMLSDQVQGQLFCMLLKLLNAKKCIEVGTYTGYNALNCALTIPKDGVIYALDNNEEFVKHGYPFFEKAGVKDKIKVKIGPAVEIMDTLIKEGQNETFDFIFVDADKLSYGDYIERAYKLLRLGGLIVLDNTFQGGNVMNLDEIMNQKRRVDAEYMHKLNQQLKDDKRFQLSMLNISDGVTLLRKRSKEEQNECN